MLLREILSCVRVHERQQPGGRDLAESFADVVVEHHPSPSTPSSSSSSLLLLPSPMSRLSLSSLLHHLPLRSLPRLPLFRHDASTSSLPPPPLASTSTSPAPAAPKGKGPRPPGPRRTPPKNRQKSQLPPLVEGDLDETFVRGTFPPFPPFPPSLPPLALPSSSLPPLTRSLPLTRSSPPLDLFPEAQLISESRIRTRRPEYQQDEHQLFVDPPAEWN